MSTRTFLAALAALALVGAAGVALAQDEPTLNESDFDTEPPQEDDSYLEDNGTAADGSGTTNESADSSGDDGSASNETGEEPALDESDFDTSPPASDESWLDDESDLAGTGAEDTDADTDDGSASTNDRESGTTGDAGAAKNPTPGAGALAAVGVLAGLALAFGTPRRPKA